MDAENKVITLDEDDDDLTVVHCDIKSSENYYLISQQIELLRALKETKQLLPMSYKKFEVMVKQLNLNYEDNVIYSAWKRLFINKIKRNIIKNREVKFPPFLNNTVVQTQSMTQTFIVPSNGNVSSPGQHSTNVFLVPSQSVTHDNNPLIATGSQANRNAATQILQSKENCEAPTATFSHVVPHILNVNNSTCMIVESNMADQYILPNNDYVIDCTPATHHSDSFISKDMLALYSTASGSRNYISENPDSFAKGISLIIENNDSDAVNNIEIQKPMKVINRNVGADSDYLNKNISDISSEKKKRNIKKRALSSMNSCLPTTDTENKTSAAAYAIDLTETDHGESDSATVSKSKKEENQVKHKTVQIDAIPSCSSENRATGNKFRMKNNPTKSKKQKEAKGKNKSPVINDLEKEIKSSTDQRRTRTNLKENLCRTAEAYTGVSAKLSQIPNKKTYKTKQMSEEEYRLFKQRIKKQKKKAFRELEEKKLEKVNSRLIDVLIPKYYNCDQSDCDKG